MDVHEDDADADEDDVQFVGGGGGGGGGGFGGLRQILSFQGSGSGSGSKFGGSSARNADSKSNGRGAQQRGGRGDERRIVGGRGRGQSTRKPSPLDNPNGHDYNPAADMGPNKSPFTEDEIHAMLSIRLQAKMSRNFSEADEIQGALIEGGVFVHDAKKEWRADGVHYTTAENGVQTSMYQKSPHSLECQVDDAMISRLVDERQKCKVMRQYEKADSIRKGLEAKFNVIVDDRAKQWSVGGDFGPEHNDQRDQVYTQSISSTGRQQQQHANGEETIEYIQTQVNERQRAKKNKEFQAADDIRDVLLEEYHVTILDKDRLWSVGGSFRETGQRPPGDYARRGGTAGRLSKEDEGAIVELIAERYAAKRAKDFTAADEIREILMTRFSVKVDDKLNEWRIDTDDYAMTGRNGGVLSVQDIDFIELKLKERFSLQRDRKYEEADDIRDMLREQFGVFIDDRGKEWSVSSVDGAIGNRPDGINSEEDELDDRLDPVANASTTTDESEMEHNDTNNADDEEGAIIPTEESLSKLTIPLLKERLRLNDLPVSGKKAELIARLLA